MSPDRKPQELQLEPSNKKQTAGSLPSDRYQIDHLNYHEPDMIIMPLNVQHPENQQPINEIIIQNSVICCNNILIYNSFN